MTFNLYTIPNGETRQKPHTKESTFPPKRHDNACCFKEKHSPKRVHWRVRPLGFLLRFWAQRMNYIARNVFSIKIRNIKEVTHSPKPHFFHLIPQGKKNRAYVAKMPPCVGPSLRHQPGLSTQIPSPPYLYGYLDWNENGMWLGERRDSLSQICGNSFYSC